MHAVSDRDSAKCHQSSLGVSTHLMLVNIFPLGSLSSVILIIAEASSSPLVLLVQSFAFFVTT